MKTLTMMLAIILMIPAMALAKVSVVASTSDLGYFAQRIGGDLVDVATIASPTADIHHVEVRPSYMMKVARADIVLKIGLELDMWMDKIIDGSRNNNLKIIDCSEYIHPVEVPEFKADARYGDLHRYGNPHYWLNPENVEPIARSITEGLQMVDPDNAAAYEANRNALVAEIATHMAAVKEQAAPLNGIEVVYYHNSWPYFDAFVGLNAAGFIEPFPGVPPSPTHIKEIIELVKAKGIKIIAIEPYFDKRVPNRIAEETGAKVVTLYPSIGGAKKGESYLEWLSGNIAALIGALK